MKILKEQKTCPHQVSAENGLEQLRTFKDKNYFEKKEVLYRVQGSKTLQSFFA